ncbi:hypothetical protein GLP14_07975 [Photobacterium carnosum]|uniref:hypothetical protein n=1 Tax=Photobacterium carnosum TaxID=2023717 RepID=UPI001E362F4B|nr:hypothetical protein [Photobacterium carnosum]MCD9522776.1 hypothetical protein [Photobacterium carnosum]
MLKLEKSMLIGIFIFLFFVSIQQVITVVLPISILFLFYICFFLKYKPTFKVNELLFVFFFLIIYIMMFIPTLFYSTSSIDYIQVRRIVFGIIGFIVIGSILKSKSKIRTSDIATLLQYLLILHAVIIMLQFVLFHIFGIEYDVLNIIGRAGNNTLGINESVFYRPSGFFLEPGTYATQSFLLFVSLCILKKPSWLLIICISSTYVMTMSVFAMVFVIIMIIYRYMISKHFNIMLLFIVLIISVSLLFFVFEDYLIMRFLSRDDQSLAVKFKVIEYFQSWPYYKYFIGNGLTNTEGFLVRDSTLFFNYIFFGGCFGIIMIIIYFLLFLNVSWMALILFIGIFISKVDYIYINFWVMTALLVFGNKKNIKDS